MEANTMATLAFDEGSNGETFVNSHNNVLIPVNVATIFIADHGTYKVWAYSYRCHLVEDNDGSPTAYGFDNPVNIFPSPHPHVQRNLHPQDHVANAGSPFDHVFVDNDFHWAGLFAMTQADARAAGVFVDTRPALRAGNPDPDDGIRDKFPVVQSQGPSAGFYVSRTATVADPAHQPWEPQRYWDASTIPYAVLSPAWDTKRPAALRLGDFGLAIRNDTGAGCGFFFADTGVDGKVGECSRKLVRTLAPNGFNEDFVTFLVFPGSGHGAPQLGHTDRVIDATVNAKISSMNQLTNPIDLALFLGGLETNFSQYVEYVNNLERTNRPTDAASQRRAAAIRQRAEPGTNRMKLALSHRGYLPGGLRSPGIFWPPGWGPGGPVF
jgi:hypothetical protein